MFNNKLIKMLGACILLFILSFSLVGGVSAGDSLSSGEKNKVKDSNSVKNTKATSNLDDEDDEDDYDDSDEDEDDYDYDEDSEEYSPNYYEFEWKGNIYYIDLDEFNLTDEELTELFTKRDALMEEIDYLEALILEMELSRNNDTLLAIDNLYDAINKITNNTEFNELLLSLKDINITELNSTFNELKILLEVIKSQYPNEDFAEVDSLMATLELLINEELEKYESLTSQLSEKLAELYDLFEQYPFLRQHTKYDYMYATAAGSGAGESPSEDSKNTNSASAEMKNTGVPYFSLAILLLLSGLFGFGFKRKF